MQHVAREVQKKNKEVDGHATNTRNNKTSERKKKFNDRWWNACFSRCWSKKKKRIFKNVKIKQRKNKVVG